MRADAPPARRPAAVPRPAGRGGFTLFEVLAAVAILAILYVTLAGVGVEGLRSESESRRRLEASLLADQQLAELETALAAGSVPEIAETQLEIEPFLVKQVVESYELPEPPPPPPGQEEPAAPPQSPLLGGTPGPDGQRESPLRRIEIQVLWDEGGFERSVSRTTFAFDASAAEALFPEGAAGQVDPGAGGGQSGDAAVLEQLRRSLLERGSQ